MRSDCTMVQMKNGDYCFCHSYFHKASGIMFSHVCVCPKASPMWPLRMMHRTSLYSSPPYMGRGNPLTSGGYWKSAYGRCKWVVRILLECFLVKLLFSKCSRYLHVPGIVRCWNSYWTLTFKYGLTRSKINLILNNW